MLRIDVKNPSVYRWILFGVFFMIGMALSGWFGISEYPWDSGYYWSVADSVWDGWKLLVLNYPETFRGYFFPLVVSVFKKLFHGVWGWRILSTLMSAGEFALILPYLFDNDLSTLEKKLRPVLSYGVFLFMWGYFLQFPLSDFPAMLFCSGGIALLKSVEHKKSRFFVLIGSLFAGVLFYASYNTRSVYLYAIILFLLFYIGRLRRKILCNLIAILVGVILLAIPQSMINHQYVDSYSPRVYSEQMNGYASNLQMQQIYWGIEMPRFEGYIDPELTGGCYYFDPTGKFLLGLEGYTPGDSGWKGFIKLWVRYPLDMTGIYVKHFISAMTPGDIQQVYVTRMHRDKGVISCVSILMWIITGIMLADSIQNKRIDKKKMGAIVPLCVPALMQAMGAVEIRFFLPVYVLMYYYLFSGIDRHRLIKLFRDHAMVVLMVIIIVFVFWISVYGSILSECDRQILLINEFRH